MRAALNFSAISTSPSNPSNPMIGQLAFMGALWLADLQVETPGVGAPQQTQVRCLSFRTMPPQPQDARLAPPLAARQPLHLYQNQRSAYYGQRPAAAPSFVRPDLRMQLCPGS